MSEVVGRSVQAHPVTRAGTRSRAGNAMGRARSGVLDGALKSVVARGTRATSMSGIAIAGGVAKATVYNHFRTKDDVLQALLVRETDRAAAVGVSASSICDALAGVATFVAENAAVRTLALHEPDVIAALMSAAPKDPRVRRLVSEALARYSITPSPERVEIVLRTLSTFLVCPGQPADRQAVVALVASALVSLDEGSAILSAEGS